MISKETFVNALRLIQEQDEINTKVGDALTLVGHGSYLFGINNKYYEALMMVLEEGMDDQGSYISWWMYEAAPDYKVWSENETIEWCLKEPEDLYDFLLNECR